MELVFRIILDVALIGLIIAAIYYAMRVEKQMSGIRASRKEMEKFVHDFGATVGRAENGIRGLKQVARDSGDDLERLIEKAQAMRDELKFVVEHADQLAERVSSMSIQLRQGAGAAPLSGNHEPPPRLNVVSKNVETVDVTETSMEDAHVKSRAERELMRALEKLRS
jgi:hypothetical protein